ncbi:MAG: serpin family protein [Desulfobacterales bacterium]|nr:serpin family protein [Desulfobacterales bacterium]
MKKVLLVMIILFFSGLGLSSAQAGCASVDDDFDISFPRVEYQGQTYALDLAYEPALATGEANYWRLRSAAGAAQNGDAVEVGENLRLVSPCADYNGSNYTISLDYHGEMEGSDGVFWELGSVFEVARSEKRRNTSPAPGEADLAELSAGLGAFTLDFYQTVRDGSGNLFFSPYSISTALAMTWAGARGETATQMASALHFTLPDTRRHTASNALDLTLESRGEGAAGQDGEGFRLNVSNAVWAQKDYPVLPAFLDIQAEHYGAGLGLLDFINAPDPSRLVINDWVSEETEEKIKDLIPAGSISSDTRLVLTNAIYFNAAWSSPFDAALTASEPFYPLEGGQTTAEMMSQTERFPYAEGEDYQAVELPFDGNELSMVILLPREGKFRTFEAGLDQSGLQTILAALQGANVQLKTPKFKYEAGSIRLRDTLTEMGMPIAFSGAADFSGIDGSYSLLISDVLHQAYISVDEAGVEAAAATAVVIGMGMAPAAPTEMTVNRPFIFFIRDIETEAILFFGRILQPE